MCEVLEIKIGAADFVSAESLGLTVGDVIRRNMAPDEVTLSRPGGALSEALGIARADEVVVRVNGAVVLRGLAQAPVSTYGANASRSVRVLGGWHHLSRVPFHRSILLSGIASGVRTGALPQGGIINGFSGMKIWLGTGFADATVGEDYEFTNRANFVVSPKRVDLSGYITNSGFIFTRYKLAGGVLLTPLYAEVAALFDTWESGFTSFGLTPPLVVPTLTEINAALNSPYPIYPRQQTVTNVSLDRVLQAVMTIVPRCSAWVDYAPSTPEMHLTPLEGMEVTDLTHDMMIDGSLSVRHDLVPEGVIIWYEDVRPTGDALMTSKGHSAPRYIDKYPADVQPNQEGVLVLTVPHPGENEPFVGNLARTVYDQLAPARIAGQVVIGPLTPEQAAEWVPGRALTHSTDPELAGYTGIIQDAAWNAATGLVRLTVGYPTAASIGSMRDLQSYLIECISGKF